MEPFYLGRGPLDAAVQEWRAGRQGRMRPYGTPRRWAGEKLMRLGGAFLLGCAVHDCQRLGTPGDGLRVAQGMSKIRISGIPQVSANTYKFLKEIKWWAAAGSTHRGLNTSRARVYV